MLGCFAVVVETIVHELEEIIMPAGLCEQRRQVRKRVLIPRPKAQRAPIPIDRVVNLHHSPGALTPVEPVIRILRLEIRGLRETCHGIRQIRLLRMQHAQQIRGIGMVRVGFECGFVGFLRCVQFSRLVQS